MPDRQKMTDLVVVLPGIMGSVLERDGLEVWGMRGGTIIHNLVTLGDPVRRLALPGGIGDDEPDDKVEATRLMPSAQIIPGFWNLVAGYTELIRFLTAKFELRAAADGDAGNLLLFPYDWRLSNRLNGRRLADAVWPALESWRRAGHPDASIILICHSMGGLVARWFLEVLGGKVETRKLITLGTPYRGSINALVNLANGFAPGIGRLRIRLDEVLRSFPAVYQLLPTYACLETAGATLRDLSAVDIPNVAAAHICDAKAFHAEIARNSAGAAPYRIHALKGIFQPTSQTAAVSANGIRPIRMYRGEDVAGDGTVPRPSAHPPEWDGEESCVYFAQQHGSLQTDSGALLQLFGILSERPIKFLAPAERIGLDVPDAVVAGETLPVEAVIESGDSRLALRADLTDESGQPAGSELMRPRSKGRYRASFAGLAPGAYRVQISSATPVRTVDPVTGLTLVWHEKTSTIYSSGIV